MNEKISGFRSIKQSLTAVGTRCADHVTTLYPQKLALTSPTGGGRSVGIVRVRTKATEFFISANRYTCFGLYLHPSSGDHITVSTVSGIIETVTATCRERDWTGTGSNPFTLRTGNSNGLNNARYYRYSDMSS